MWIYHSLFSKSPICTHLGFSQYSVIINNAKMIDLKYMDFLIVGGISSE